MRMRSRSPYRYAAFLLSIVVLPATQAEEFSWQVSGSHGQSDTGIREADSSSLIARYYFRPVDDELGPYNVAAFLDRSSELTVAYDEGESEGTVTAGIGQPPQTVTFASSTSGYTVSGRYIWRNWYVGASLGRAEGDTSPTSMVSGSSMEQTAESLELGRYLGRMTTVALTMGSGESTTESAFPLCVPSCTEQVRAVSRTESDDVGLKVFHLGRIKNRYYSVSAAVISSSADLDSRVFTSAAVTAETRASLGTRRSYSVAGELFATTALSFRLGYTRWDGLPLVEDRYDASTTWFFKRNIAAQVFASKTGLDASTGDIEDVGIRLIGRF